MTDPAAQKPAGGTDGPAVQSEKNGAAPGDVVYITPAEAIEVAPSDLREKDIRVPEWDRDGKEAWVRIRTLTGAERARIRQVGVRNADSSIAWAEMEVQQFLAAVTKPKFTEHQVRKLHQTSGAGFSRIIAEHDELASMSKEELAEAREEFREER